MSKYLDYALLSLRASRSTYQTTRPYLSAVAHTLSLLLMLYTVVTFNSLVVRGLLFSLSFFFIAYWFISIFVYLFKKAQYGTYTRIIQRFWKRALWLFWAIELFLFCIYLFLAIISPQEVSYLLDHAQLVYGQLTDYNYFFSTTFYALLVILLTNVLILSHKYNTLQVLGSTLLTVLLIRALYEDFIQLFAINQAYNNAHWGRLRQELTDGGFTSVGVWELECVELKARTISHYVYLLIFLKLWHTLFICMFFFFFETSRLHGQAGSYNVLSANLQNFYFLFFFNYILKLFAVKAFLNYLGSFAYFWFYVNYNAAGWMQLYYLASLDYFW